MAMNYANSDPIILGSGELYIGLASDIADLTSLTTVEEEALINIGAIEAGASLTITNQKADVVSANRGKLMKFLIDRDVKFTTGILTWDSQNVCDFLLGGSYSEEKDAGDVVTSKKMVVGSKDVLPDVYLRFVHTKKDGGKLTVNIYKANFDGELSFLFEKEKATTINYEFMAMAHDTSNYVEIIETMA